MRGSQMAKRPKPEALKPTAERDADYYRTRDFKGMLARINRDGWLELKKLSAEIDMSFQDIMVESLNDFLRKHDRRPVVESRVLPKG